MTVCRSSKPKPAADDDEAYVDEEEDQPAKPTKTSISRTTRPAPISAAPSTKKPLARPTARGRPQAPTTEQTATKPPARTTGPSHSRVPSTSRTTSISSKRVVSATSSSKLPLRSQPSKPTTSNKPDPDSSSDTESDHGEDDDDDAVPRPSKRATNKGKALAIPPPSKKVVNGNKTLSAAPTHSSDSDDDNDAQKVEENSGDDQPVPAKRAVSKGSVAPRVSLKAYVEIPVLRRSSMGSSMSSPITPRAHNSDAVMGPPSAAVTRLLQPTETSQQGMSKSLSHVFQTTHAFIPLVMYSFFFSFRTPIQHRQRAFVKSKSRTT